MFVEMRVNDLLSVSVSVVFNSRYSNLMKDSLVDEGVSLVNLTWQTGTQLLHSIFFVYLERKFMCISAEKSSKRRRTNHYVTNNGKEREKGGGVGGSSGCQPTNWFSGDLCSCKAIKQRQALKREERAIQSECLNEWMKRECLSYVQKEVFSNFSMQLSFEL